MKIGILTFHRAHNYGAVLQCYAMQEVLKGMGHEVEVIDYRQKYIEEYYKPFSLLVIKKWHKTIRSIIGYIIRYPQRYIIAKKRKKFYNSFLAKYLSISSEYNTAETLNYDVCIVGSDQLWGIGCLGGEFDDVYLGNFKIKEGGKKVAYAISSNLMSIDYLNSHDMLLSALKNFNSLSFRESIIIDKIKSITAIQCQQCLDPTLLTDKEIWQPLLNDKWKNRKYVVCYHIRGSGKSGFSVEQNAAELAEKNGWDVVNLSKGKYSVDDFVSSIANAQYVVTTSFHATVFSLIFQRQLAAYLLHDGHDSRYEDILRKLHCEQFIYEVREKPKMNQIIDWNKITDNLTGLRKQSFDYLVNSIKNS